jgi:hypothetical protein
MSIPFKANCFSIREQDNNIDLIYQEAQTLHKHIMDKSYLILSKNDFGRVKKRVNIGYFNKKTNFIIGEKHSIVLWDDEESKICSIPISEALKDKNRYYLFYDMNFIIENNNNNLFIEDKITNNHLEIILNKQFGYDIGLFLKQSNPETTVIPEEFKILESIIQINSGKLSINKYVLINSNFEFLLGILEGYIGQNKQFILKNNFNIYNITYILNLLGAQYSIRTIPSTKEKQVRFKLPNFLKEYSNLPDYFFREYKFIFHKTEEKYKLKLEKSLKYNSKDIDNLSIFDIVNSGLIEMIRLKDLVFIEQEESKVGYDLTMGNPYATNYSLPGTPILENSDGDVLGVIGIMTKDGAEECIRKFSVELKVNFLNLIDGKVNNWGVKLDSQLGLFTATK